MSSNHNRTTTYYIYKITNNLNGKTYIGQHKCPDNKTPWTDASYTGSGIQIIQAKKKYGIENFSKEILAVCHTYDTINILEIAFIALYRSIGKAEYNVAKGGKGGGVEGIVRSEETRQKIREARAKQAPMSEEAKAKFKQSIAEYWESEAGQLQRKINSERNKKFKQTKGKHWYNNGKINVVADECPEGFVPGKFYTKESIAQRSEKYSQWYNNLTEEQRQKRFENMSKARKGKKRGPYSEEYRKRIGDGNRGRRYYNNGVIEVMRFEQPDGFVPGRLPSIRDKISANLRRKH